MTLAVLVGAERLRPHSPVPLVTVAAAIAASWLLGLNAWGVATVGEIPRGLPSLSMPDLTLSRRSCRAPWASP